MATAYLGRPLNRLDGRAKVTGGARYAAEYPADRLAYGVVITSIIARGRITNIDARAALELPGVLAVLSHENAPRLARANERWNDEVAPPGRPFRALQSPEIHYSAQPVALVVAETFELARHAATLVRIDHEATAHATDLDRELKHEHEPPARQGIPAPAKPRGDPRGALQRAAFQHDAEYLVPAEHHNPMELFGTTVVRNEDGAYTVYDKTQGVLNVHRYLCSVFGLDDADVHVVSPFVGGAFGLGLRPQYQVLLALMAARELERSVRVTLTRQQMFGLGFRPMTWQRIALGASADGTLESIVHEAVSATSQFEEYTDPIVQWTGSLYKCENVELSHRVVSLDLNTPCDMRAPGAAWGFYALECAMDELAVQAGIDPLEFRLRNYSDWDQTEDKPFTSKSLRECYQLASERFGWKRRDPRPRSMREGNRLVGWGMASGMWEAMQDPASARAVLTADGRAVVSSATADIGTGSLTVMTQIAAETLGLPIEDVTFLLGDSRLPNAPVEGGSFTTASVGTAVQAACAKLAASIRGAAARVLGSEPARTASLADLMRQAGLDRMEEVAHTKATKEVAGYSHFTHSAVFAEVKVDADFGTTQVTRVVSAIAGGRIVNPKTARSQIMGGIIWGIGMALEEESVVDHNFGRFMTRNFADYHIPVNADVHDIDIIFVDERDDIINPLGVKGLGEPGLVGVAAAIANAVYHATGIRIRSLPITPDRLL